MDSPEKLLLLLLLINLHRVEMALLRTHAASITTQKLAGTSDVIQYPFKVTSVDHENKKRKGKKDRGMKISDLTNRRERNRAEDGRRANGGENQ